LPHAEIAHIDWDDAVGLESHCRGIDVVIHAAGMDAHDCSMDPVAALEFNGVATARLALGASRAHVKRILYLSTAHVYRSPLLGVITEDSPPVNLHPYATSNIAGENAVMSAVSTSDIQGVVLRMANVFGVPTQRGARCWGLVVNDLCRQAVANHKMTLRTDGGQKRDFIGMTDICRIIERASTEELGGRKAIIVNIGTGISRSLLSMAEIIGDRCGHIFGFKPELIVEAKSGHVAGEPLDYRSIYRDDLRFNAIAQDPSAEIDELLIWCYRVWGGRGEYKE
jgi:UDP-glucose 4-epimerase